MHFEQQKMYHSSERPLGKMPERFKLKPSWTKGEERRPLVALQCVRGFSFVSYFHISFIDSFTLISHFHISFINSFTLVSQTKGKKEDPSRPREASINFTFCAYSCKRYFSTSPVLQQILLMQRSHNISLYWETWDKNIFNGNYLMDLLHNCQIGRKRKLLAAYWENPSRNKVLLRKCDIVQETLEKVREKKSTPLQ